MTLGEVGRRAVIRDREGHHHAHATFAIESPARRPPGLCPSRFASTMNPPGAVATAPATILTENERLADINADYQQRYGFDDVEHYLCKAPKGPGREIVEKISESL
jgi:hypothetical protein